MRMTAGVRVTALGLLALTAGVSTATPYVPDDDATVLERVTARSDLERLAPLRAAVSARPADLEASLALATGYMSQYCWSNTAQLGTAGTVRLRLSMFSQ